MHSDVPSKVGLKYLPPQVKMALRVAVSVMDPNQNRKEKNLNQLKVAMDLNISREALSHYENGKRSPDIQMLRQLSDYFDVSIDYLINGKEFSNNKL